MRPSSGPGNNGSNQLVDFEDVFTGSESEGGIEAEGKEDKHLSTNTNQDFQISKRQLAEAGPGPSTMKRRRVDFESQVQTELEKPEGTKGFLLFYLLTIRNITDKLVMPGFQVDKPESHLTVTVEQMQKMLDESSSSESESDSQREESDLEDRDGSNFLPVGGKNPVMASDDGSTSAEEDQDNEEDE